MSKRASSWGAQTPQGAVAGSVRRLVMDAQKQARILGRSLDRHAQRVHPARQQPQPKDSNARR